MMCIHIYLSTHLAWLFDQTSIADGIASNYVRHTLLRITFDPPKVV
jgi:hypothetical protein